MRYRVCGLTVSSDTPLPELPSAEERQDGQTDLRLRIRDSSSTELPQLRRWVTSDTLDNGQPWLSCAQTDGGYLVRIHEFADFFIDAAGREVICSPDSQTSAQTLRHLFIDQVLPLVLNLRGQDALHATSVLTSAGLCAFVGPSGAGKSTLAAAFQLAGYPVLSDDCLVVREENEQIVATPAYPGVRLWEDTIEALRHEDSLALPVADYTSKRRMTVSGQANESFAHAWPLLRIYALVRSSDGEWSETLTAPAIEPLSRGTAFLELVASLFRLDQTDREMLTRQFRLVERILSVVTIRRLLLPNALSALPAVRDAVLADLQAA